MLHNENPKKFRRRYPVLYDHLIKTNRIIGRARQKVGILLVGVCIGLYLMLRRGWLDSLLGIEVNESLGFNDVGLVFSFIVILVELAIFRRLQRRVYLANRPEIIQLLKNNRVKYSQLRTYVESDGRLSNLAV